MIDFSGVDDFDGFDASFDGFECFVDDFICDLFIELADA